MEHLDPTLIPDLLARSARLYPNRVALSSPAWRLTYGDVHARTNALAHALVARGVRRGDAVVIFGRGSVQTAMALWAVLKANATAIVLTPDAPAEALRTSLEAGGASVLLSEARVLSSLEPLSDNPGSLAHAIICGAVETEQLPALPGAVCAVDAMAGQPRRFPPVPEGLPTDVAFLASRAGMPVPHTHRAVIARLPVAVAPPETHPSGLLGRAAGIERMLHLCRDGALLRFERRLSQSFAAPTDHAPRTP